MSSRNKPYSGYNNLSVADGWGGSGSPSPQQDLSRYQLGSLSIGLTIGFEEASLALAELPPTPLSYEDLVSMYLERYQMHLIDSVVIEEAMRFGVPFSFAFEQGGATVQNIFPIKSDADDQISSSSSTRLQMHTETAFHPKKPDFVFLCCLRADNAAGTTLSHIDDILKSLSEPDIRVLQQPVFSIRPDLSFIKSGADPSARIVSVLDKSLSEMTYDEETMTPLTGDAEVSFSRLQQAIASTMQTIVLKEHEYVLIPNKKYVHGRTPFAARYDGTDRWLKRIMLRSVSESRKNPNDHLQPLE